MREKNGPVDAKFNEIVMNDLKESIAKAFIDLDSKLRENSPTNEIDSKEFVIAKASQMKKELNNFIDGHMKLVIRD